MEFAIVEKQQMDYEMNDLTQRKALGLSYLEKNSFVEAVNVYKSILTDYPNDIESYLLLGDLYIANEDYPSAEKLYQMALSLEPENLVIQRRVKLSSFELKTHASDEIPTDSASVSKLLQELIGRHTPITEAEIESAASLLSEIVHAHNPAEKVAAHLDEIDSLLPALIELNIRQARNDRRFDLVNLLQALQESIAQLFIESNASLITVQNNNLIVSPSFVEIKEVTFLLPDQDNISERINYLLSALQNRNCAITCADYKSGLIEDHPDLVVACNPHIHPENLEKMAHYSAQHIPIILDLDEDFEYLPINHPEYTHAGLGSLEKSRSFTASMLLSNLITVPSESMASHIRETGYKVEVVPFGWSEKKDQWKKGPSQRNTINIGLIGIHGNFEDVQQYRRIIIRILREFPQTKLVVCGDSVTYKMFENISENRRVFLPNVPDEEMSYIFGQIDILLVPLTTTPFHLVTNDRLLMQAGIKGIPWIASPMPDFVAWQAGGVTTENPDEWHSYLRQFIQDKELRITLGQAGKSRALLREEALIAKKWLAVIKSLSQNL